MGWMAATGREEVGAREGPLERTVTAHGDAGIAQFSEAGLEDGPEKTGTGRQADVALKTKLKGLLGDP
jgi:hypothetical protein